MTEIQDFHYFPLLPPEIRTQIWLQAVVDLPSRTVLVTTTGENNQQSLFTVLKDPESSKLGSYSIPPLLQCSSEPRSLALALHPSTRGLYTPSPPVYVNFHTDTFYVTDKILCHLSRHDFRNHIRKLKLRITWYIPNFHLYCLLGIGGARGALDMVELRDLTIVGTKDSPVGSASTDGPEQIRSSWESIWKNMFMERGARKEIGGTRVVVVWESEES